MDCGREGQRMKKRLIKSLTTNWTLKLISLLLAFIIWLAIVNISNPTVVRSVSVPLEVINEELISDADKIYEIDGNKNVQVYYEVALKSERMVSANDFKAVVDLSKLYDVTGSVKVQVENTTKNPWILGISETKPGTVRVKVEDKQKKKFDLKVKTVGDPQENYTIGDITIKPDHIYVSGPISEIGKISSVGIEINTEGVNQDIEGSATPVFYDANGNKVSVDTSNITLDFNKVSYQAQVLSVNEVPIHFNVEGNVAAGYKFVGAESAIRSVTLSGNNAQGIKSIDIPASALNISGLTQSKTVTLRLSEYIPVGLQLKGSDLVNVTLHVEPVQKKTLTLALENIAQNGAIRGYHYQMSPEKIQVFVSGGEEITPENLHASMDLSGMEVGSNAGKLQFSLPSGYRVESYTPFTIEVSTNQTSSSEVRTSERSESESTVRERATSTEVHTQTPSVTQTSETQTSEKSTEVTTAKTTTAKATTREESLEESSAETQGKSRRKIDDKTESESD